MWRCAITGAGRWNGQRLCEESLVASRWSFLFGNSTYPPRNQEIECGDLVAPAPCRAGLGYLAVGADTPRQPPGRRRYTTPDLRLRGRQSEKPDSAAGAAGLAKSEPGC